MNKKKDEVEEEGGKKTPCIPRMCVCVCVCCSSSSIDHWESIRCVVNKFSEMRMKKEQQQH